MCMHNVSTLWDVCFTLDDYPLLTVEMRYGICAPRETCFLLMKVTCNVKDVADSTS